MRTSVLGPLGGAPLFQPVSSKPALHLLPPETGGTAAFTTATSQEMVGGRGDVMSQPE